MVSKWGDLGVDMVTLIEESVVLYIDKVRFRSVCNSWNSILAKLPNLQAKQLPCLFYSLEKNKEASHGLFNPLDNKVYLLDLFKDHKKYILGSSNGWVACSEVFSPSSDRSVYQMNPLTGSRIELPPRQNIPAAVTIYKVLWSSAPSADECVVFATFSSRLGYCKRNDDEWTFFTHPRPITDIIFHEGKLHALTTRCELYVFENFNHNSEVTQIAAGVPLFATSLSCNLVESSDGGLMMVQQEKSESRSYNKTFGFRVYKHDPINLTWFGVKSIGDEIIFVGKNSSLTSVSCRDFPGFKGNRIYFKEYVHRAPWRSNIGVFNLEDETIESLFGFESDATKILPVWVTLSPF